MNGTSILHYTNIVTHVFAGSLALLAGIVALLTKKGGKFHAKSGQLFLLFLAIVIGTGLIGVLVFGRNIFLLVITILSGYLGYSGYRTLQTKSNIPSLVDILVAIAALIIGIYFIYYFKSIGMIWSPIIIYSTVGALFLIVVYDLIRYFIPKSRYQKLWLYEHIYKMVGAFSGILSAFTGTVLPNYKPYSQFLPSVLGIIMTIGFMTYYTKKSISPNSKTTYK